MNRWILATVAALSSCGVVEGPGGVGRTRATIVSCPQSPAKEVFNQALCLCGDYRAVGDGLWVKGGSAGVNGSVDVVGTHSFEGDLTAWQGISGVGTLTTRGSLSTPGRVEGVGRLVVGGDLSAGSGVSGVGHLEVKGTLRCGGEVQSVGELVVGAQGPYTALAGPPCECDPAKLLDVGKELDQAKAQHDNEAAGLGTSVSSVGTTKLVLGSGKYFFDKFETVGQTTITIDGVVALYIDGSLDTVGGTRFDVTPGATLDLYVRDGLNMVGDSMFGVGADPGSVRIYLAGSNELDLVGTQRVVGAIYAPQADVSLIGTTTFDGGLFARNVDGVGKLVVSFTEPIVRGTDSEFCRGVIH